ncbi:MAG: RNase adapter RapZ [Neisseriaceae bacterium]
MQLILISGLAGAGKSTALKILEDSNYYCVDNLPPPMLVQLIETYLLSSNIKKVAVGVDTRSYTMLRRLPNAINDLTKLGIEVKIIYLDAKVDVLIKRFSETRRKHPLSDGKKTISDCIAEEQEILSSISSIAHRIDTSDLTANGLRTIIKQIVGADYSQLNIVIQSFGFKYGLPIDSDFVFDVRCLPNPYYDLKIRDFNGTETPIIKFLAMEPKVQEMINDIFIFIKKWLGEFSMDNRNYITIAIGCTGGKHRSVYIAEEIAKLLTELKYKIIVRHRQLL